MEQTITSVLDQGYPNLEYIIIDGGSTDGSVDIIKKYESGLAYWVSEPDGGMYEAIQKGFDRSAGEIMAWLNSDDMYHPNSLFTVAEIFLNIDEVEWIVGARARFDEKGRTIFCKTSFKHNKFSQFFNTTKYISQESTFWRRSLWEKIGGQLNTSMKYAGDYDLWLRFNKFSQAYIVNTILGGFGLREGQASRAYRLNYHKETWQSQEFHKQNFSSYEKKIYDEITFKKSQCFIDISDIKTNSKKINKLAKTNPKIIYNIKEKKFMLKNDYKNDVFYVMNKRRNTKREFLEMMKMKFDFYPDLVLDVGVAQGTKVLYEVFPESYIILFEPLDEFEPFLNEIQNSYSKVSIENCALGSREDTITINVHPDLVGSSIYIEDEDSDVNGAPRQVQMNCLDNFSDKYNFAESNGILLKIDVQGAELDVLKGARKTLGYVDVVILEASLFDFFNNNVLMANLVGYMDAAGFDVYDMFDFMNRPLDGALAQVDIAFVKKTSAFKKDKSFASKKQREELNKKFRTSGNANEQKVAKKSIRFTRELNTIMERILEYGETNKKYVVYGNGTVAKLVRTLIPSSILGYVDMADIKNHPVKLLEMKYDGIIISVLGREAEIVKYLTEELKIEKRKILALNSQV